MLENCSPAVSSVLAKLGSRTYVPHYQRTPQPNDQPPYPPPVRQHAPHRSTQGPHSPEHFPTRLRAAAPPVHRPTVPPHSSSSIRPPTPDGPGAQQRAYPGSHRAVASSASTTAARA